jgi:hypothetical protein
MILYYGGSEEEVSRIRRSGFTKDDECGAPHGELAGIPLVHTYQWFVKPRKPNEFKWQVLRVTLDLTKDDLHETTEYGGFWPEANIYWLPVELVLRANPRVRRVRPSVLDSRRQLEEHKRWKKIRRNPVVPK